MAYLNYRRNMRYTTKAPRDTIAFVLCVLCLFARNNKPLKCQKGYRLCNSTHSIFYHGRQVTSVFNTPETFPKPQQFLNCKSQASLIDIKTNSCTFPKYSRIWGKFDHLYKSVWYSAFLNYLMHTSHKTGIF